MEARAYKQNETFAAALRFARTEAIIPGPEPAHAIRAVIDEAEAAKQAGEERVILLGLSGHGHFDMSAYEAYLAGRARGPGVLGGGHGSGARAAAGRPGNRLALLLSACGAACARPAAPASGSGSGGRRGSSSAGAPLARHRHAGRAAAPAVGHGSASPLSQAGPRPPGHLPRNSAPSAPEPERLHDRRDAGEREHHERPGDHAEDRP